MARTVVSTHSVSIDAVAVVTGPTCDIRLVPAALTAWAVTAAGIVWPIGESIALMCGLVGAVWVTMLVTMRAKLWTTWFRCSGWQTMICTSGVGVLGVVMVGMGFGIAIDMRSDAVRNHPILHSEGRISQVMVIPEDIPRMLGGSRVMFRGSITQLDTHEISGRIIVFAPAANYSDISLRQPVIFTARITRPTRRDLTVAVVHATGIPIKGQAATAHRIAHAVRTQMAHAARAVLPSDQAAILPGLVLGDTSTVTSTIAADFRTAGLTHLTAVSGANVTIVCGAVMLVARCVGPRLAVLLAAVALVGFVIVVQPSPSVLRAALMGALGLLAVLSARSRQAIPVLSITVLVLMIVAPQLAVDSGFALSVSATIGLIVLAPVGSAALVARGYPKILADALCIAGAAQLVTMPLIAAISGRLSVVAVLANLAAAIVVAPITVLGTAAAALGPIWPSGAELLIRFTGPELWWLLHTARIAAGLPGAGLPVPSGWAGFVLLSASAVLGVLGYRRRWCRYVIYAAVAGWCAWSLSVMFTHM